MIFDLHNDLPTRKFSDDEKKRIAESVDSKVIYAFWTTEMQNPLDEIAKGTELLRGKNRLFAIEDCGFMKEYGTEFLSDVSPLYCGLTHNPDNALAGGAMEGGELTEFGKEVILRLNELKIPVDTAHLNRKSFYQVAEIAERIIDSHTGWESYYSHLRNLTDEQVKIVLERGGIIGLTAVKEFIGGGDAEAYADFIDSFVQRFGIEGVSIGTDFYGTQPLDGLKDYTEFYRISESLSKKGYDENSVNKIFYQNADKYFSRS